MGPEPIHGTQTEMPPKLEEGAATKRMQLVAPASWFQRVEEWRRTQPRIPSKSEAVRILVDRALGAEIKGGKK